MIKITNLEFSYTKDKETLKNINLEIKKGSWVSILGHNGSGKSTLAKLLVGLGYPESGHILIDDIEITEENLPQIRKKIGIVFQNPDNQFVGVTVKHDIAFGLENQRVEIKEMQERILKHAKFVNMADFLDKEPHNLSGGQKQRVAIAGILAMDQEYIILDEATSMLDPEGTRDIVSLIGVLNKKHHKTVITITHDLAFASLSDSLVVLNDGEIILEGKPEEVFKEEALLESAQLEIPVSLKVYNEISKDENAPKHLMEALWAYNSKM